MMLGMPQAQRESASVILQAEWQLPWCVLYLYFAAQSEVTASVKSMARSRPFVDCSLPLPKTPGDHARQS